MMTELKMQDKGVMLKWLQIKSEAGAGDRNPRPYKSQQFIKGTFAGMFQIISIEIIKSIALLRNGWYSIKFTHQINV